MARMRFSIAWLMGFVLVAALGVGGLRSANEPWASGCFTLMIVALTLAILRAVQARGRDRAYWAGFAMSGTVYFATVFGMGAGRVATPPFLTELLVDRLEPLIHPETAHTYASTFTFITTTVTPSPPSPPPIGITGTLTSSLSTTPPSAPATILPPPTPPVRFARTAQYSTARVHYRQVAHSLTALLFGMLGGWTSLWLFTRRDRREAGAPVGEEISPSSP